jgi:excisionase family DNA binding protein
MNKDDLTLKEAAERLGLSRARVATLIRAGRLPARMFGTMWVIRERDLALVAERTPGRPKESK